MKFFADSPKTVSVKFDSVPDRFYCMKHNGNDWELYYFRELHGKPKYGNIIFNICHPGNYFILSGEVMGINPLAKFQSGISFPPKERNRLKPFFCVVNDSAEMKRTPARNFTGTGKIEVTTYFLSWPYAIQLFIMLHEIGHFFYKTEKYCDLYAAKIFIDILGFNPSTAYYSLSKILSRSPESDERLKTLYENLIQ
jgi:hypothetical protein